MIDQDIILAVICSTLLILLLIAVLILVFFISGRRRAERELIFERELRQVETEVSEHLMGQFGQELHDNIGQLLTAMHIQIENQKLDHPQLAEGFKTTEIYLAEVSQQLRLLSRTLNNDHIGHVGLFIAMQLEIDRLHALKRFTVHWSPEQGVSGLDRSQELMVFRIFQEITQNALRHSAARNLYIETHKPGEDFELTVRDDGKGFDCEKVLASQRISGLRNIMKRARLAGLSCTITSAPGEGCRIGIKKSTLQ